jgi:hypothetical protein
MIILNYPQYVGGKFIANCLALSRHCVIQSKALAQLDLKFKTDNPGYYEFKLKSVMKSLPPQDQMKHWLNYEFGCDKLYGIHEEFYKQHSVKDIRERIASNTVLNDILSAGKWSCTITHDYRTLMKQMLIYPQAKILEFKNFDNFRNLSAKLKGNVDLTMKEHKATREYYYKDQEFYQLESFVIDVDNTFMEWYPFSQMMSDLYDYLGFDDYNSELMYKFWVAYTNLHRP